MTQHSAMACESVSSGHKMRYFGGLFAVSCIRASTIESILAVVLCLMQDVVVGMVLIKVMSNA